MKFIFDFFEELDEMVYVSDAETYELIYMNAHLRNALGYGSKEEYVGKHCYEVLQGVGETCKFCNNHLLKQGSFISWVHKNPVMDKRFLIKDSLIEYSGRKYRIEIAIDIDAEIVCKTPYYYARSETMLNECLQRVFSTKGPEDSLEMLLKYIGETFLCDRVYVFEINNSATTSNTYEWCAKGVSQQKDILQNLPLESIDWWIQMFEDNSSVIINDLEEIRVKYPEAYAILKPQNISTLAAGPISIEGQIVGFLGVDNPNKKMIELIMPLLNVIGYFIGSLLKRRDLLKRLNELSFHDPLTGAFNRNAMSEHGEYYSQLESIGVIYCDITGLKRTNDSMGHDAGDRMIQHCYKLIRETLCTDLIYRTGGDEFVSVCPNCTHDNFEERVFELRSRIKKDKYHVAVGYVWTEKKPFDLENLISRADKVMYQDKRNYYAENFMVPGIDRRYHIEDDIKNNETNKSLLQAFLATTYNNIDVFCQSLTQQNSSFYFYFGDLQKDLFYISDNMKEKFGFRSNVVPGLLSEWEKCISTKEHQELYRQDIISMIKNKRTNHDLRYQVCDVDGNNIWIRCYGVLHWNEDKTIPLFFSGRVSCQDNAFVIDPITNFPGEYAAVNKIENILENNENGLIIGFSLNNFSEINETKGRAYANRLLQTISNTLIENLSSKMSFYRLDGIRCMALIEPECKESKESLVKQIQDVIEKCYYNMDVPLRHTCSFGIIEYPCDGFTADELVENVISLIKVAKTNVEKDYIDYVSYNMQHIKEKSNMTLALSQNVLNGMENFRIMVQPVVSAKNGNVIGGEVLLRWSFEGKDVSPDVFIPILEKERTINIVGRWVFEQAVCSCMRMMAHNPDFYLTFNVSLHQLSDVNFIDFMKDTLEKYYIDGSRLVAELTESCLDEYPEKLKDFVKGCKKLGVSIALDDFGSGYSSLRMLLQYPSKIIKLDRSLLKEITQCDEKLNFVRSIVYACHQFGKLVCMEGVEREEENSIIKDTGCDMIQGYYYYKPMELSAVYRLLSSIEQSDEKI